MRVSQWHLLSLRLRPLVAGVGDEPLFFDQYGVAMVCKAGHLDHQTG